MFGDNTTAQADASYCTTILNNKYNDFNKASHDWLDNNTDTVRGYNVVYADDCSGVNNFQDALLLYIIFSTDNVSSDSSDDSYLVVDSDTEKQIWIKHLICLHMRKQVIKQEPSIEKRLQMLKTVLQLTRKNA